MEIPLPNLPFAPRSLSKARIFLLAAVLTGGSGAGLFAQSNLLIGPDGQAFFAGQDGVVRINTRTDQLEKLPITLNTTRLLIDAAGNLCGVHLRYDTGTDLWQPAVWRYRGGRAETVTDTGVQPRTAEHP